MRAVLVSYIQAIYLYTHTPTPTPTRLHQSLKWQLTQVYREELVHNGDPDVIIEHALARGLEAGQFAEEQLLLSALSLPFIHSFIHSVGWSVGQSYVHGS